MSGLEILLFSLIEAASPSLIGCQRQDNKNKP
jgi:hypothetical protein